MRRVFVDSGGFYAVLVADDAHHSAARSIFEKAASEGWALVTTNAVVFEAHALLLKRAGREVALGFLDMLEEDDYQVERVRSADEIQAVTLIRTHRDKDYSLCDALSFVVMQRLDLSEAVAFDRHFRQYGCFKLLG